MSLQRKTNAPKDLPPEAYEYYMTHPVEFAEEMILGLSPEDIKKNRLYRRLEPQTKSILYNIGKYNYVSVFSGRGCTKCGKSTDYVLLADGSYVKYGDLINTQFHVLGMNNLWNKPTPLKAYAKDNGTEECLEIITQYGSRLTRTYNHPLLTFDGWKACSELKIGDRVAMPEKIDTYRTYLHMPEINISKSILKFLAYMIGDGYCPIRHSATFTQPINPVLHEFNNIIKGFNCKLVKTDEYTYRISKLSGVKNEAKSVLRRYGLEGKTSHYKFVPKEIFITSIENQRLFLNRLFATDGMAHYGKRTIRISYSSTSYQLVLDIKRLLLRFGIISAIKQIKTSWTHKGIKKYSTAWILDITGSRYIIKFSKEIGIFGKDDKVAKCCRIAKSRLKTECHQTTGCFVWPEEALKYLLDYRDKNNIPKQEFRYGIGVRERAPRYGKTVKEYTIRKFLDKYEDEKIRRIYESGAKWDKIVSIKPVGKQPTVAITVPGAHNYVTDLFEHNTTSLALAAIWWIWTRNDAKVVATGPKFEQLKITLWNEISKWLDKSFVNDEISWTSERIFHINPKMHSFGQIMTSKEQDNMAGVHATHVLWLIDEASNVDQAIINAITGGMTDPESKIVMTGNPTKASGPFFDTHNKLRDEWKCLRFSSEDSALKNKVWFKRMQRYPKESDIYRVYVSGLPPLGNPKAIISLADCHAAVNRELPLEDYLEMGVDPAREGNDLTAISIRRGMKLLEVRVYPKTKGPEVITYTLKMLREYRAKTGIKSRVKVKIDDHGLGGPIGDELALNETDNIEVIPCLFGGKGDEKYADPASIMWFGLADIINDIELCNDEELIEELSTREWNTVSGGRMQVEPKAKYKERLGRSPDRADATVLCYYGGAKKVFELPDIIENKENDFEIDWHYEHLTDASYSGIFMIDVLHYAALVFNKDLSFNGLSAIYQYYSDKLWIYEEFYQDRPEPDVIARVVRALTHKGLYDDDREVRVIGNEHMFRPDGDRRPLSDVLIQERLYISEPLRYDEYGAIAFGSKMFSENKVIMHRKLTRARPAISLWSVKKGTPETDENGFCKAFLLILSEVRRRIKEREIKREPKDYSPVHVKSNEREKSMNSWCGR